MAYMTSENDTSWTPKNSNKPSVNSLCFCTRTMIPAIANATICVNTNNAIPLIYQNMCRTADTHDNNIYITREDLSDATSVAIIFPYNIIAKYKTNNITYKMPRA